MANIEVPSDDEVVEVLAQLSAEYGERVTARRLCEALIANNHPLRQSQLAIQRAAERGRLDVHADWTLSIAQEAIAA